MQKNKSAGFTLIEVLIVIAIIGILAAIAIPRFVQTTDDAKKKACQANIATLNTQIESWHNAQGSYPAYTDLTTSANYFPDGAPSCPYGVAYAIDATTHRIVTSTHAH